MQLSAKDLVLIILRKNEETDCLQGITRIEKLAYLISKSPEFNDLDKRLEYKALHYGPYSEAIVEALEILNATHFIESNEVKFDIQEQNRGDEVVLEDLQEIKEYIETKDYTLTAKGKTIADYRLLQLSSEQRKQIDKIIKEYGGLRLKQLLKQVYEIAPEDLLKKSTIRGELGI
jgi:uncharacterized protein YwgA